MPQGNRHWGVLFLLAGFVGLPACSLVLDFDDLKSGSGDNEAGQGGDERDAGTESCADGCDDGDPCTTDTCEADSCVHSPLQCEATDACSEGLCVDGECQELPIRGVVPDGVAESIQAGHAGQTVLVAADGRAYAATFVELQDGTDVVISTVSVEDEEVTTRSLASGLQGRYRLVSPAALAPRVAGGVELFVGITESGESDTTTLGNVMRMVLESDLGVADPEATILDGTPSFRWGEHGLGPSAAFDETGTTAVAWYGESEGTAGVFIAAADAEETPSVKFVPEADAVAGLAALGGSARPAAAWLTARADGQVVRVASDEDDATELNACYDSKGQTGVSLAASRTLDSLWTLTWTVRDDSATADDSATTESAHVFCTEAGCVPPEGAETCEPADYESRVSPGVEAMALGPLVDESGAILWQATALVNESGLGLVVNRVELDDENATPFEQISQQVASPREGRLPESPGIVMISEDRLVVSWIERGDEDESDTLHLQRHRICLGL